MIFKMKHLYIAGLLFAVMLFACKDEIREAGFEDIQDLTAYDYIKENEERFSSFLSILEKGGLDKRLSAYNPEGNGYTLFLPDNEGINQFIDASSQFSSLNDLLENEEFAAVFSRFHVINRVFDTNAFPLGAFNRPTLSDDFLTVSFVTQGDTSFYKINNEAAVTKSNIKVSNGLVHEIETALTPITFTSYDWFELNTDYSILKNAVDLTGLRSAIDFNSKDEDSGLPVTILAEPDSVYNQNGILSVNDLIAEISPNNSDYTSSLNPLYNFVAYHFLTGRYFIDDFVDVSTNYTTLSDIPLNINGKGLDIAINKGKQVFDTLVYKADTTFIDFIKFNYDASNVITQTGVIHFIDRMMKQQTPSRSISIFQFYEEKYINDLRQENGTYLIEYPEDLVSINWSGADLFFVKLDQSSATGNDYLQIDGDFLISYTIPKIVQGSYTVYLKAEAFNVFIDGTKLGSLIDLTRGGSSKNPFMDIKLGTIEFKNYSEHQIKIRSLVPGRFLWDYIKFEPL